MVGFDYLARTRAALSSLALGLLSRLDAWREPADLFTDEQRAETSSTLLALLDLGFVLVEGTPAADLGARLERDWEWGPMAAHYHFGIKDTEYQAPDVVAAFLEQRAATTPRVPLHTTNAGLEAVAAPPGKLDDGALGLMYRRRSSRAFDPARPLPLAALADCLFAGFGVVAFAATGSPGEGPLPLTMTPSGGARNPFEAHVVARAVAGLAPGVYHYSGLECTLALVRADPPPASDLLGGQEWFADAAAVVLLVAHFDRCTWKYPHPTGFRVLLLEAGHIAQNVLLAATAHDLAATPTCAISDHAVEEFLGLDRVTQAAVHAIALGPRAAQPSPADPVIVERLR
jgi:SagB-type dehydrogenase family enzyme